MEPQRRLGMLTWNSPLKQKVRGLGGAEFEASQTVQLECDASLEAGPERCLGSELAAKERGGRELLFPLKPCLLI